METLGILIGLLLFISASLLFSLSNKRRIKISLFEWFIFGVGIFYGLFFSVVVYLINNGYETESTYWIKQLEGYYFIYFVLIFSFVFSAYFGFVSIKNKNPSIVRENE